MKTKTSTSEHFTVRLPLGHATMVRVVANGAGWSESKAIAHLVGIGFKALDDTQFDPDVERKLFKAFSDHHKAQEKADKMVTAAEAKVRRAAKPRKQPAKTGA